MNETTKLTNGFLVCFLAILCCILWGSAFPSIKLGYQAFAISQDAAGSQILFAGIRFTLAGILTILFGSLLNHKFLLPKKSSWPLVFKLCLFQTVAQYLFFYIGLAHTTGVKGSIMISSNVFLSILIPSLLLKQEKLTFLKIAGCLIGFIGVVLINVNGTGLDLSMKWMGEGFIFLSALSYTCSSILIKDYSKREEPVILSGYQFLVGGLIMVFCGKIGHGTISEVTVPGLLLLLYLALVSAVAYTIWAMLLKYNPVGKVAVYGFMNPVCGVILSAVLLKESSQAFGYVGLLSLLLVCIGIFMVNHSK